MAELQLQPSLETDLRSQAHLALIKRLGNLDLSPILVYRIASLADSAVLPMAWQWDVLNPLLLPDLSQLVTLTYPDWDSITNIDQLVNIDLLQYQAGQDTALAGSSLYAQYRALILLSTSLHSIMGTAGALKRALAGLGYANAAVQEGQDSWGGTQWPPEQGWAVFRVLIDLATVPASADITSLSKRVTAICNFWKPARCWLDSVQFQWHLYDTLIPPITDIVRNLFMQHDFVIPPVSDFIAALFWPVNDTKPIVPQYNQRYYFTGVTYGQNQPHVADGPVVINGVPVSANG
jgi:hypothetical protein